jgi:hypothetical protein
MTRQIRCDVCNEWHPIDEQGLFVCFETSGALVGDRDLYWSLHKKLQFSRRRVDRARRLYNARRRHHKRNWFQTRWDAMPPQERAEMCCYILQYPWDPR